MGEFLVKKGRANYLDDRRTYAIDLEKSTNPTPKTLLRKSIITIHEYLQILWREIDFMKSPLGEINLICFFMGQIKEFENQSSHHGEREPLKLDEEKLRDCSEDIKAAAQSENPFEALRALLLQKIVRLSEPDHKTWPKKLQPWLLGTVVLAGVGVISWKLIDYLYLISEKNQNTRILTQFKKRLDENMNSDEVVTFFDTQVHCLTLLSNKDKEQLRVQLIQGSAKGETLDAFLKSLDHRVAERRVQQSFWQRVRGGLSRDWSALKSGFSTFLPKKVFPKII